jgi:hypothetical protein
MTTRRTLTHGFAFIVFAAALILICILCTGCVYTKWVAPDGKGSLTRISFIGNQSVGKVDLLKGTMEAYQSEQAAAASAAAEGFAKGLVRP